jgi:hypothetical protein
VPEARAQAVEADVEAPNQAVSLGAQRSREALAEIMHRPAMSNLTMTFILFSIILSLYFLYRITDKKRISSKGLE